MTNDECQSSSLVFRPLVLLPAGEQIRAFVVSCTSIASGVRSAKAVRR